MEIALELYLPTAKLEPPPYFVLNVKPDFSEQPEQQVLPTPVLP